MKMFHPGRGEPQRQQAEGHGGGEPGEEAVLEKAHHRGRREAEPAGHAEDPTRKHHFEEDRYDAEQGEQEDGRSHPAA